ncbi:MAG: hypothetical protein R2750_07280 [Bacteroidales bacterium]
MEIKQRLIERCRELLLETENNLKSVIDDAQKAANEYGLPRDRYDSFRTQLLRKRDMFAQQLAKNNEQLNLLEKIDPDKKLSRVEFGALVITEYQKLFISISLGKMSIDGEEYYAISAAVPVYKAMEHKKAGEEFIFHGKKNKIISIS